MNSQTGTTERSRNGASGGTGVLSRAPRIAALAALLAFAAVSPAWALLGDLDGSGRVDGLDLILLSRALGAVRGEPSFADAGDLDGDGRITDRDLAVLRANFARTGRDQNLWVADTGAGRLVKVNVQTGHTLLAVPLADPRHVAADPASGDCWATESTSAVVRVTAAGRVVARVGGFVRIEDLAVDGATGACWLVDSSLQKAFRVPRSPAAGATVAIDSSAAASGITSVGGFNSPKSLALDGLRDAVWVLDSPSGLYRLSGSAPPGYSVRSSIGYHLPNTNVRGRSTALNKLDGSLYISGSQVQIYQGTRTLVLDNRLIRVPASNAGELFSGDRGVGNLAGPGDVAVNSMDGSAWIADASAGGVTLVAIAADGGEIVRVGGFRGPVTLSVDPLSGALWAADAGADRIAKISPAGSVLFSLSGFSRPGGLAVLPGDSVRGAPLVNALVSPAIVQPGDPVGFSAVAGSSVSTLTRFEWDFDGNGSFDFASDTSAVTSRAYSAEGVYRPVLKVTDTESLVAVDYSPIVRVGRLRAFASATPVRGEAPLRVDFTARAVNPLTGRIDNVQWDFDGDGSFESFQQAITTTVTASQTYATAGVRQAVLKVTDEAGRTAQDTVRIEALPAQPRVNVSGSPSSGLTPLRVSFSAYGNVGDAQIALHRWDFQGDGTYDFASLSGGQAEHYFTSPGSYPVRVEVTDTKGLTATAVTTITVTGQPAVSPAPPVVLAEASALEGSAPFSVDLGGRAKDPDGRIVLYEWRFDDPPGASFADSPDGPYTGNTNATLTSRSIALGGASSAVLTYWQSYSTETSYDRGVIEISLDGGAFSPVAGTTATGFQEEFVRVQVGIPDLAGKSNLVLRLKFTSDTSVNREGWFVDDLVLRSSTDTLLFSDDAQQGLANFTAAGGFGVTTSRGLSSLGSSSATTAAARHTYASGGIYRPRLTVHDDGGHIASSSVTLRVAAAGLPRAAAIATPQSGRAPISVLLDGSGSSDPGGSVTRYQWSFYSAAFIDDLEGGASKWTNTGGWQISPELTLSGSGAWNDSPGGMMPPNREVSLVTVPFDLPTTGTATLSFWHRVHIDDWDDYARLEFSGDGGTTWTTLSQWSGTRFEGLQEFTLTPYQQSQFNNATGRRGVLVRFRLTTDADTTTGDGWVVDDIVIRNAGALTFDQDSASPTAQYTYRIPGAHPATLRVSDSAGGSSQTTVTVFISSPATSNATPVVQSFSITPREGSAPFHPSFYVYGRDPDGSLVLYELDLNGDGVYDYAENYSFNRTFLYSTPGRYAPRLRVTDNRGMKAESTALVIVTGPAPDAAVTVSPRRGRAPLQVDLAVTASSPAGSPVTNVLFDFDGYAPAEYSDTSAPFTTSAIFPVATTRRPKVTVLTADGGKKELDCGDIVIRDATQVLAQASASTRTGPAPLSVQFSGSASVARVDDAVKVYRWDFENDGRDDYESATNPNASCVYGSPGSRDARFSVETQSGDRDTVLLRMGVGAPPVSTPRAAPLTGTAPLTVMFFCDGVDPDGTIDNFEWDFDGDGSFDTSTRISRNFKRVLDSPGTYDARLRVTDQEGFVDTKSVRIVVLPAEGAGEASVTVDAEPEEALAPMVVRFWARLDRAGSRAARYRWDFDSNGTIDLDTTAAGAEHLYLSPGEYDARVTVTDSEGRSGTKSVLVRAKFPDQPSLTAYANPSSGAAPLRVSFSSYLSASSSGYSYEWDFDGDGSPDYLSASTGAASYLFERPGRYLARVRATDPSGRTISGRITVDVKFGLSATRQPTVFDPDIGQKVAIRTVLSSPARVTLRLQDDAGRTVRHLVRAQQRPAGMSTDVWDGTDELGRPAPAGVYSYAVDYEAGSVRGVFDPTGEVSENQLSITPDYDRLFNPLQNKFLSVRFTLDRLAEATLYVVDFPGYAKRRVKTILLREPLAAGSYVVPWDGTDDSGNPAPVTDYIMPVFFWELPPNAVVVAGRPILSDPGATSNVINPVDNPYSDAGVTPAEITYSVSKRSRVDVAIYDETNRVVQTMRFDDVPAGKNAFTWDCRSGGQLVDEGTYRVRVLATDGRGNTSPPLFVPVKVVY
ncbi:MAG: PKD domain-containing protein [Candidatus Wallbacteria bacterium]|nr:PKD domain-containing protein [Candidatus Wallbacteria bacterium]